MNGGPDRIPLGPGAEFDLIRRLLGPREPLPPGVLVGPGDDCAVLEGGLVVSIDQTVEGIHYRKEWITSREAGYRAAATALSDLAAMAAEPIGVLLALAVGRDGAEEEAVELQGGVEEACRREGVQILGGDLSGAPGPSVINVVALGRAAQPVLRGGTVVGDEVWVTGWLGGSAGAVAHWDQGLLPPDDLRQAFARPVPRIREALWLKSRVPLHGLIDISDGLAGDAGHLAAASGLAIVLREESIPGHPSLLHLDGFDADPLHLPLEGGEDFELCFTVPEGTLDEWVDPFQDSFGLPLARVGRAVEGRGLLMEDRKGEVRALERAGYSHFAGKEEG